MILSVELAHGEEANFWSLPIEFPCYTNKGIKARVNKGSFAGPFKYKGDYIPSFDSGAETAHAEQRSSLYFKRINRHTAFCYESIIRENMLLRIFNNEANKARDSCYSEV